MLRVLLIIISLVGIRMISLRRPQTIGYNDIGTDKQRRSHSMVSDSTSKPIVLRMLSNYKPIDRRMSNRDNRESDINKFGTKSHDSMTGSDVKANKRIDNYLTRVERRPKTTKQTERLNVMQWLAMGLIAAMVSFAAIAELQERQLY